MVSGEAIAEGSENTDKDCFKALKLGKLRSTGRTSGSSDDSLFEGDVREAKSWLGVGVAGMEMG